MSAFIENARRVIPGERIVSTGIRSADGNVSGIGAVAKRMGDTVVDAGGRLLTPGLVDQHVHGVMHHRFENGVGGLPAASRCFDRFGTTTVLPTFVPKCGKEMSPRLSGLAAALDRVEEINRS